MKKNTVTHRMLIIFSFLIFTNPLLAQFENPKPGNSILYVSKLGDNSDGSSWAKAFNTIQAALHAIPDDRGGYGIIIRPDTYFEANLIPGLKEQKIVTISLLVIVTDGWDQVLQDTLLSIPVIHARKVSRVMIGGDPFVPILKDGRLSIRIRPFLLSAGIVGI